MGVSVIVTCEGGCIHSQKACAPVRARAVWYNGFEHKRNELDRGCGLSLSACIMLHAR